MLLANNRTSIAQVSKPAGIYLFFDRGPNAQQKSPAASWAFLRERRLRFRRAKKRYIPAGLRTIHSFSCISIVLTPSNTVCAIASILE